MTLPPNIVYECSTARRLVEGYRHFQEIPNFPSYRLAGYISDRMEGQNVESEDSDLKLMEELLHGKLTKFDALPSKQTNEINGRSTHRTCVSCFLFASKGNIADTQLAIGTDWRYWISRRSTYLAPDEEIRSMEHHVPSQSGR